MSILLLQVVSTWFMVGSIWTIQVVHYPLLDPEIAPVMSEKPVRSRIRGPTK